MRRDIYTICESRITWVQQISGAFSSKRVTVRYDEENPINEKRETKEQKRARAELTPFVGEFWIEPKTETSGIPDQP